MVDAAKFPSLLETTLSCTSPIVDADQALDQAHAILALLASAFQVDQEADRLLSIAQMKGEMADGRESCFRELSGELFHDALSGVSTLLAAYKHVREEDRARRSKEA
ncbi:hypothetical protein [Sphingobium indicum]|uniref:hypothetical protein n=1 Tax=Sphingobium indicum TaxID=332055 RepID=UPI00055FFD27|nr:hypothetical protein [Sphingobium indicum]